MNARKPGKRNAALVTGALVAVALGGTAAVVAAVAPAEADVTGTSSTSSTSSTPSTSDDSGGLSVDDRDGGSAHGQSAGS